MIFKDQLMKEALKPKITNNTNNNLTMNMRTEYARIHEAILSSYTKYRTNI